MAKYEKEVKELLEYVGGKENIASLMHCVTRLRFVLKDESKVDIKKIEALPTVKGTFTQAGQFQVIIGNQVSEFYKEFAEYAGIQAVSKEEVKQAAKQNQNLAQRAVSNLAEIFAPLIPAIIVGGLLLGFRSVIGDIYMLNDGTATLKDVYPWCQGLYDFLWLICEAALHFLPIGVVWSITKKMKGTEILGIVTGVTLVSPQLINAY